MLNVINSFSTECVINDTKQPYSGDWFSYPKKIMVISSEKNWEAKTNIETKVDGYLLRKIMLHYLYLLC